MEYNQEVDQETAKKTARSQRGLFQSGTMAPGGRYPRLAAVFYVCFIRVLRTHHVLLRGFILWAVRHSLNDNNSLCAASPSVDMFFFLLICEA